MKTWIIRGVAVVATVIIAWWLVRYIDLAALGALLRPENLTGMLAGGVFFQLMNVARGVRIARMSTRYVKIPVSSLDGVGLATVTNLANHVLPLRLGEVVYVTLSRTVFRIPVVQGAGILLTIRLYDLVGLLVIALGGLLVVPQVSGVVGWPVFAVLLIALLVFAVRLDLVFAVADRLAARFAPKLALKLRDALHFTKDPMFIASSLGYALLVWGLQACGFAILLRTFDVNVSFGTMLVATSIANLAAVLPLSALGTFGALEAGWTAGFVALGVDATAAATSGLAVHLVIVAVNALASLAFAPSLVQRLSRR